MQVDGGPCTPWPNDLPWGSPLLYDHRGESFCDHYYHYAIRANETTGKPETWVIGLCPRSISGQAVQRAESEAQTFDSFDPKYQ